MSKDDMKKENMISISDLPDNRKKASELSFFKPAIDIDEIKNKKELDYFRRSRRSFLRFVFVILGIHNVLTILIVVGAILLSLLSEIRISLNVIIPAYFVNITVQVFALMGAVVKYFDKEDFLSR